MTITFWFSAPGRPVETVTGTDTEVYTAAYEIMRDPEVDLRKMIMVSEGPAGIFVTCYGHAPFPVHPR